MDSNGVDSQQGLQQEKGYISKRSKHDLEAHVFSTEGMHPNNLNHPGCEKGNVKYLYCDNRLIAI
jgi:hypothetical protein